MCIAVPMIVETVNGLAARCVARDCYRDVSLLIVADEAIAPGDHLLVHQGLAMRRVDAEEAALIWEAFDLASGGRAVETV